MKRALNRLVRAYLTHSPFTDGKKALLARTRHLIAPSAPRQVARTRHGFDLVLNLANPEQERIYYYGEHDERYETAMVKALVAPGMTCWDVGANIGFYACLLARAVGAAGRVVAFEPASATRARLAENVALNRFVNVEVSPLAIGATEGRARIHYRDAGSFEGTASLHARGGQGNSEEVAVTTLDALAARLGAPDFVKIDVEGGQLDAWRGGRELFSRHAPLVMAELRDSSDDSVLAAIDAEVRGLGYRVFAMRKGARPEEVARVHAGGPRNYVLARAGSPAESALLSRRRA